VRLPAVLLLRRVFPHLFGSGLAATPTLFLISRPFSTRVRVLPTRDFVGPSHSSERDFASFLFILVVVQGVTQLPGPSENSMSRRKISKTRGCCSR
jgi:hypothetical protein